jgi:hypothetical protein
VAKGLGAKGSAINAKAALSKKSDQDHGTATIIGEMLSKNSECKSAAGGGSSLAASSK